VLQMLYFANYRGEFGTGNLGAYAGLLLVELPFSERRPLASGDVQCTTSVCFMRNLLPRYKVAPVVVLTLGIIPVGRASRGHQKCVLGLADMYACSAFVGQ